MTSGAMKLFSFISLILIAGLVYTLFNFIADSFLEKFPYCIPSMFSALICVAGVVTVGCLLPDKPEDK